MTPVFLLYFFLFPYDIAYVEMVPVRSPAKLEKLTFNFTAKGFCCLFVCFPLVMIVAKVLSHL